MIFVSINPFALKRFFFFFLVAIGFSCLSCFADSLFLSVKATPYDKQMSRIRPILDAKSSSTCEGGISIQMVDHWIGDLRSIPYGFTQQWKTPEETESGEPADCKAKAVALYKTMQEHGATRLRLVIGKRSPFSRSTHAWLEWASAEGDYVLDPTWNWKAFPTRDVGRLSYVPYYAFEGSRKFRAASATLVAQN
jgi:hypothetical protein